LRGAKVGILYEKLYFRERFYLCRDKAIGNRD